jgi:hypothetical protein
MAILLKSLARLLGFGHTLPNFGRQTNVNRKRKKTSRTRSFNLAKTAKAA